MRLSTNIENFEDIKWAREGYCPTEQGREFIGELTAEALRGGGLRAEEAIVGTKSSLLLCAEPRYSSGSESLAKSPPDSLNGGLPIKQTARGLED